MTPPYLVQRDSHGLQPSRNPMSACCRKRVRANRGSTRLPFRLTLSCTCHGPPRSRVPRVSTLQLTSPLRATIMALAPDPLPEWLTGHRPDRTPSAAPHMAFLPMPHVGHLHADGHVLGVALALPNDVASDEVT